MLSFLGSFTSGGLNIGGNALSWMRSAATNLVMKMAQGFWGGLKSMFSMSLSIAKSGFQLIGSLFSKAFNGLKTLGKGILYGFAAAIGATVVAVQKATERLKATGNAISDIRGATGLGSGAAGAIQRNFNAFGLNPSLSDTNPLAMGAMSQAWGLPGMGSRNFTSSLAGRYQNSDPMSRNYMLQSMQLDTPEMRRRLMAPTGMLREQERFSGQVNAGIGVDPRTMEVLAQRTELVTQRARPARQRQLENHSHRISAFQSGTCNNSAAFCLATSPRRSY